MQLTRKTLLCMFPDLRNSLWLVDILRFLLKLSFLVWLFLRLAYGSKMRYYVKALQLKWITKGFHKLICMISMFWEGWFTRWAVVAHSHYFSPLSLRFIGMWLMRGVRQGWTCLGWIWRDYVILFMFVRLYNYLSSCKSLWKNRKLCVLRACGP